MNDEELQAIFDRYIGEEWRAMQKELHEEAAPLPLDTNHKKQETK